MSDKTKKRKIPRVAWILSFQNRNQIYLNRQKIYSSRKQLEENKTWKKQSNDINDNIHVNLNKGNNKITELRTILQRESQIS